MIYHDWYISIICYHQSSLLSYPAIFNHGCDILSHIIIKCHCCHFLPCLTMDYQIGSYNLIHYHQLSLLSYPAIFNHGCDILSHIIIKHHCCHFLPCLTMDYQIGSYNLIHYHRLPSLTHYFMYYQIVPIFSVYAMFYP
jgi:hypothetical protein